MDNIIIILIALIVLILIILGIGGVFLLRSGSSEKDEQKEDITPAQRPAAPKARNTKSISAPKEAKTTPKSAPSSPPTVTAPAPSPPPSPADSNKIRILVVDDNADTIENVTRLIYFEDDMEVIGQAYTGRQGLEMAIENQPHIVLMDINMPDMDGITATQEIAEKAPFSQVIIMSVQSESQYLRQAMVAGAKDFQAKPFTAEELINSLRRVFEIGQQTYNLYQSSAQQEQDKTTSNESTDISSGGKVIAVYSPKGGIGTSAIAANFAVALQQIQGNVALVDCDLQFGDILVHLNLSPNLTISDLVQEEGVDADLLSQVMTEHDSGLKILLSPPKPEYAEIITADAIVSILENLRQTYEYVVVDTSHILNEPILAVLEQATYILLVAAPELPSVKSSKLFLDLALDIEMKPEKIGVVINRVNIAGSIPSRQIKNVLRLADVYEVPDDPKLALALNKGLVIVKQDPASASAQAINALAEAVLETVKTR